jgi:YYY domain-containing protein
LALGALAVTNSWDFPTYGLLFGLTMLGAAWRADGAQARGVPLLRLLGAGLLAAGIGLASLMLYAPFFDRYWAPVGGVGQVAWESGTSVSDYLLLYGVFAALLLPTLGGGLWRLARRRGRRGAAAARPATALGIRAATPSAGARWLILGVPGLILVLALLLPASGLRLILAGLLLGALSLLLRRELAPATWYALLLAWLGWAVSLGIELVYIRDHLDGSEWYRMNTVFKFGLHIWVLLALAAAALLPLLLGGLRRLGGATAQALGLVVLALLLALAAIYPLAGTPSRVANRFDVATGPTLDGLAFMEQAYFEYDCLAFGGCEPGVERVVVDLRGDAAAIAWLNRTISGTPIIVQSNLSFYRAYGIRIAANTGLPTVVSALHVNEQRDPAAAARRDRDLERFYRSSEIEQALRFLASYGVDYVYVGGGRAGFLSGGGAG